MRNRKDSYIKYLSPRLIKIRSGQTITWVNRDDVDHELVSGNTEHGRPDGILSTGVLKPSKSFSKRFAIDTHSIPYFCLMHPEERGTIIVQDKYESEICLKERVDRSNQVSHPTAGEHLKHQAHTLSRYEDPIVREGYFHHEMEAIHNSVLTIVFWDISSFSKLCNILKNEPHLIVEFLQEYFTVANKIIHKHDGVLDKFIGDGIMAYFGYKDTGDGTSGAVNSINAAFELHEIFRTIKVEWIEIWKKQFHYCDIPHVDLKCGINTGDTLVGKLITEERDQFTAFGPTVNLASRLEQKAEGDQIIISENTKYKIENRDKFNLRTIMIDQNHKIKAFEYINKYYEVLKH